MKTTFPNFKYSHNEMKHFQNLGGKNTFTHVNKDLSVGICKTEGFFFQHSLKHMISSLKIFHVDCVCDYSFQ